jgi:L-amino acid N-acyltransferase YncA
VFSTARFAIRPATIADAGGIAAAQVASWRSSYGGILPARVLADMDPREPGRVERRRELIRGRGLNLVAYDTTHRDIVGFCHAGTSRRGGAAVGELYEIYLVDRAKRFGLGRELFDEFSTWCLAEQKREMAVWVLEDNHHARAFYAALGGRQVGRLGSRVGGFPVVEVSYVWPL